MGTVMHTPIWCRIKKYIETKKYDTTYSHDAFPHQNIQKLDEARHDQTAIKNGIITRNKYFYLHTHNIFRFQYCVNCRINIRMSRDVYSDRECFILFIFCLFTCARLLPVWMNFQIITTIMLRVGCASDFAEHIFEYPLLLLSASNGEI